MRPNLEPHQRVARGILQRDRVHRAADARGGLVQRHARRGHAAGAVPRLVQGQREEGRREAADPAAEDAD
jgi:hypothetical protein